MSAGESSAVQRSAVEFQVTVDAADPARLAAFWSEALRYRIQPPPPGFDTWEEALDAWGVAPEERNSRSAVVPREGDSGPRLFFQQVPESKTTKNRVHLDLRLAPGLEGADRTSAHEVEVARLVELGATVLRRVPASPGTGDADFVVMADPEGNEFCVD